MNGETQDGRPILTHDLSHDRAAALSRRRHFMKRGCAWAATLMFLLPGGRVGAPALGAAPADSGYRAFIALSQRLTGRTSFDAVLGRRIYAALVLANAQFEHNVRALNGWLQAHGGVPSDVVTAALKPELPELAATVGDIVRAWYLGLIGEPPNARVLAYEKALMFDAVDDVLTIPSYCRDLPFYWTHKPAVFDLPAASPD